MKRTKKTELPDGYYRTGLYRPLEPDLTLLPNFKAEPIPYYKVLPTLSPELRVLLLKAVLAQEATKKAETEQSTN